MCGEEQVHLIEMYEILKKQNYDSLLKDGIHPDDKGHEMIYKIVRPIINGDSNAILIISSIYKF